MKFFIILSLLVSLSCACPSKFKNASDFAGILKQCSNKLGLSIDDLDKNIEKISDPEADDQCLSQCIMEKLDVLGDDGGLDRDGFFDYLEEQAPKPLLTKLTEIVNKCADSSEIDTVKSASPKPKGQDKPSTTLKTCKVYHDFNACFISNAKKLC